ncbi:hypothetical protein HMPREF2534_02483 [Bacteroides thetaiotaomicron]|nr:hypothetical protein HMPREF2534_02483 [Bacteroides thetaiotaomicron]
MRLSERTLFPIILLCHPKLVEESFLAFIKEKILYFLFFSY